MALVTVTMALPALAAPPQEGDFVGGCHEGGTGSGDFNTACGGSEVGSQSGGGGAGHYGNPTGFSGGGGLGGKNVEDPGGYGQHCTVNDAGEVEVVGSREVC
jgi:hypothetical protein